MRAHISLTSDVIEPGLELDALNYSLRYLAQMVFALSPNLPEEMSNFLSEIEGIRFLTCFVAANAHLEVEKGQQILEMDNIKEKMHALISHLTHEKEILTLGEKI